MTKIITKPWGEEILLTEPDLPYSAKIMKTNAGKRWSLQYHDQKTETHTLLEGEANLTLGTTQTDLQVFKMVPHVGYTIKPNTVHRIEAITDCLILETSTPEKGTTYRLEDDYHRPNETEEVRNSPNRGWNNHDQ